MFSYTPAPTSNPSYPVLSNGERIYNTKEKEIEKENNNKVSLEQLFHYGRIKQNAPLINKILFLFYLPFGLVLLLARMVLFVVLAISIVIFPRSIGDFCLLPMLRIVCGMVVRHNNENRDKPLLNEPHIIAGNHINDFDAFAMWAVAGRFHPLAGAHLKDIPLIGRVYTKLSAIFVSPTTEGRDKVKQKVLEVLKDDPVPILIFPEGGLTNGQKGTMMYHRFVFSLDCSIVPAAISLRHPWPIHHDYLGSTFLRNLTWLLIVPFIIFDITLLPTQRRNEGETAEEFAGRVQKLTSDYLNIEATKCSYSEKKELWKQISSGKKKIL